MRLHLKPPHMKSLINDLLTSTLDGLVNTAWKSFGGVFELPTGRIELPTLNEQPPPKWLINVVHDAAEVGLQAAQNQAIQTAHDATRECRTRALDIMETVLSQAQRTKDVPLIRLIEDACAELRGEVQGHDLSPAVRKAIRALSERTKARREAEQAKSTSIVPDPNASYDLGMSPTTKRMTPQVDDAKEVVGGGRRSITDRKRLLNYASDAELDAIGIGLDIERKLMPREPDDSYRTRLVLEIENLDRL